MSSHAARLAAYKAICAEFGLEPDWPTCAAEDYAFVLEGTIELTRFVAVTQHDDIVYVEPAGDDLDVAFDHAARNVFNDIWNEFPLAVIDLDVDVTYRPDWSSLNWINSKASATAS